MSMFTFKMVKTIICKILMLKNLEPYIAKSIIKKEESFRSDNCLPKYDMQYK